MKTKPKKQPKKKLSPRARKKEMTGVNLASLKKRIAYLENLQKSIFELLQGKEYGIFPRINKLESRVYTLEGKKK